jgi:hypothetical protein
VLQLRQSAISLETRAKPGVLHGLLILSDGVIENPSKGPPPQGLSGTGIDGWLGGDFDRLHT